MIVHLEILRHDDCKDILEGFEVKEKHTIFFRTSHQFISIPRLIVNNIRLIQMNSRQERI